MLYQLSIQEGDKFFKKADVHYQAGDDKKAIECFKAAARNYKRAQEKAPTKTFQEMWSNKVKNCELKIQFLEGTLPPIKKKIQEASGDSSTKQTVEGLIHHSSVSFENIGGLESIKRELKYALGVSLAKKGDIDLESWKNWLFYGPPGTGKTLLAAATSNLLKDAAFFNVKVSSITSKYFGDSTKIISQLYEAARKKSPSVIFLDEFESICGSRGGNESGVERRILSTILAELDGLSEKGRDDIFVLTIAATNRPWDLDPAVLSRFDKKILVPLPDPETRRAILDLMIYGKGYKTEFSTLDNLVVATEGLSGREIERLVKEVTNTMVMDGNKDIIDLVEKGIHNVQDYEIKTRPLREKDFAKALLKISPVTSQEEYKNYQDWKEED